MRHRPLCWPFVSPRLGGRKLILHCQRQVDLPTDPRWFPVSTGRDFSRSPDLSLSSRFFPSIWRSGGYRPWRESLHSDHSLPTCRGTLLRRACCRNWSRRQQSRPSASWPEGSLPRPDIDDRPGSRWGSPRRVHKREPWPGDRSILQRYSWHPSGQRSCDLYAMAT